MHNVRNLQAFDKHTSLMISDVPSYTADLTADHRSAMQCLRRCYIAAVLYTTIWKVILGLHFVQDVMI